MSSAARQELAALGGKHERAVAILQQERNDAVSGLAAAKSNAAAQKIRADTL